MRIKYKDHIFLSISVHDVTEELEQAPQDKYLALRSIDNDTLDSILYDCMKTQTKVHTPTGEVDLNCLDRVATELIRLTS